MRRLITALGIALTGLLLLLAVGFVLLPAERVARIAADQMARATGREVTISGDVSMSFWPVLGASVGGLEVGNAEWADAGAMISARGAAIGVDAGALLRGEIRLTHIEAQSPTIRLESRADGRANWVFTDASGAASVEASPSPGTAPQPISIERLDIRDATLIYDAEGSDLVTLAGVDVALSWPDPTGAVQIDAALRPAGDVVTVRSEIEQFAELLVGAPSALRTTLETSAGQAAFDGTVTLSGAVKGALSLQSSDTARFLSALALPALDLPQGLGRQLDLKTGLDLRTDRTLSLTDLAADLGGNSLRGAAQIDLNGTPQIDADLRADALNLTQTPAVGSGSASSGSASAAGWPTAPIDASGLSAFNGTIRFAAQSIQLDTLTLGPTRATLRNERARMVFALDQVAAYGGSVQGQFVMNNRSGLSVGGTLTGSGLGLEGLLSDMADVTRLSGAANASVEFLGVGQSVDAIMRSLRGAGQISTSSGTIRGLDLDRLMRSGQGAGGTTVFDSLTASFATENGVLRNSDLLMSLPNYEARGEGQVDLGGQTLDYTFTPKALRGNDGRGIAIPVRVRGPWAAPRVEPDLEAMVDLNLAAEKDRLQEKAADEVGDRLGVTREEGQSLEDAIEDKVEDEIRKGLKSLFD